MSLIVNLSQDGWSQIFLVSSRAELYNLSQVCKAFDEIFHERYPWQYAFTTSIEFTDAQKRAVLQNASAKNYYQFLVVFIQQVPRLDVESILSEAGTRGDATLIDAFFQSKKAEPSDFYRALNHAAFHGHVNIAEVFIRNTWELNLNIVIRTALEQQKTDFVKFFIENKAFSPTSMALILLDSVKQKNASVVKTILNQNYCHPAGIKAALNQAAADGQVEMIETLIQTDYCAEDAYDGALATAAQHNQLPSVKLFVENKRVTVDGVEQATIAASAEGHVDLVDYLISTNKCRPAARITALTIASRKNHLALVNSLIKKVPDLGPSLQAAAESGHLEVFQALLTATTHSPEDLKAAAKLAAKNGHLAILEALKPSDCPDILPVAIDHNQCTIVEAFIQKKWIQQIPFDLILNPIKEGYHEMVELLLKSPPFQDLSDLQCFTMFSHAKAFLNILVMRVLLECKYFEKIAPDLETLMGGKNDLVLQMAAQKGHDEVINKLNPKWYKENVRFRALKTAVRFNQLKAVKALCALHWKTAITIKDLILPLQKGFDEISSVLIDHHPALTCDDLYTLLHYATKHERPHVLQHLTKNQRFNQLKNDQIQTLASLSKNTLDPGVRTVLRATARGYEFSGYLLVRCLGKLTSLVRWMFSIIFLYNLLLTDSGARQSRDCTKSS
jgi:ankyrin repeat protein